MRSSLEPLPRAGSPRGIVLLVAMLVGGIALSVHEYLESERTPRREVHARPSSTTAEVCPQRGHSSCSSSSPMAAPQRVADEVQAVPSWVPPVAEPTVASPAPSAFEPESG